MPEVAWKKNINKWLSTIPYTLIFLEDAEEKQINIDIMEENSEDIAKKTDIME